MDTRLPAQSPEHRLALLRQSLQQAVELEFATIPAYLCALWSIQDNLHPAAKSIRNVVQEEMLHLALACNMLASIGGRPRLYDTGPGGLRYPTRLPGEVHPELTVRLSGLNDDALDDFLEIEMPQGETDVEPYVSKYTGTTHSATIGALYSAIEHEFLSLRPAMRADRQVSGPLSWFVVDTPEKLHSAVTWIKEQGEGAIGTTIPAHNHMNELSHFYRFWEVRRRQRIEYNPDTGTAAFGAPLPFPDVWPVAPVPEGGYRKEDVSPEVWDLTQRFDQVYSRLIKLLESAWGEGGQAALWRAIETMFDLETSALPLMRIPIPGGSGNYGPSFRLVKV